MLGERARELHVPPDHWTEDLLETHEEFVQELREMGDRAAPIVEKVKKREELVQVHANGNTCALWSTRCQVLVDCEGPFGTCM